MRRLLDVAEEQEIARICRKYQHHKYFDRFEIEQRAVHYLSRNLARSPIEAVKFAMAWHRNRIEQRHRRFTHETGAMA